MSNYVEQMWASQSYGGNKHLSKSARVTAWVIGVAAAISLAVYATQAYWYPYVSPYVYR